MDLEPLKQNLLKHFYSGVTYW